MITAVLVAVDSVPEDDGWLTAGERARLASLRIPKRRAEWRAGRFAARQAVSLALGTPATTVSVRAARDGAPEAYVDGHLAAASVSISHSNGRALCLVARPRQPMGCDLERVEPRADVFARDWFLPSELDLVERFAPAARDLVVTIVWSAKESALKAVRSGLRRDTRSVEVTLGRRTRRGWRELCVADLEGGALLRGWWRTSADCVVTFVTARPAPPPAALEVWRPTATGAMTNGPWATELEPRTLGTHRCAAVTGGWRP
jgi:4'-phosphopantetheinyl transferase